MSEIGTDDQYHSIVVYVERKEHEWVESAAQAEKTTMPEFCHVALVKAANKVHAKAKRPKKGKRDGQG